MRYCFEALLERRAILSQIRDVHPPGSKRIPRRYALVDIKLLRLGLIGEDFRMILGLSVNWEPAQPSENLSPMLAAEHLKSRSWERASVVRARYRKLQLRFPPEQFPDRHVHWRPAAELLGSPLRRLAWYWQSGLIPDQEILEDLGDDARSFGHHILFGQLTGYRMQIW